MISLVKVRLLLFLLISIGISCWKHTITPFTRTARKVILTTSSAHAIGIDLGTTFSLVSAIENGKPKLIRVDGDILVPSVVSCIDDRSVLVGKAALHHLPFDPQNTFSSVKRLIGRSMKNARETGDLRQFGNKRLFTVKDEVFGTDIVALQCPRLQRCISPMEISSQIIKHLVNAASDYFKESINRAVITVPAHFTSLQRDATRRAGEMAGLEKVKLLAEPEAAAFAFGLDKKEPHLVLVFDLGGGTFDVSVLDVGDGMAEVIATSGDSHLGGDDFDQLIMDWIFKELTSKNHGLVSHIKGSIGQLNKLRGICTQTKILLSKNTSVNVDLNGIQGCDDIHLTLSRSKFNAMASPLLSRLMKPLREVALMAGVNLPGEFGEVQDEDAKFPKTDPIPIDYSSPVDYEYDALHQLKQCQIAGRKNAKKRQQVQGVVGKEVRRLQKLTADSSLSKFPGGKGIENVILVGGATRMPCIVNLVKTVTHIDPKRYINPDEAVCLGAGIMAGVLEGSLDHLVILNPLQAALMRLSMELQQNTSNEST